MFKDLNNKIEQLIEELGTDKLLSDEQIADQYNDFKCNHIEIEKSKVHKDWFNFTLELEFPDADHPDFNDYVIENGFYNKEDDRWAFDNWYPQETMDQLIALVLKEIEKFEAVKNEDLNNTIKVTEIDWDAEDTNLPSEVKVPASLWLDEIADYLSDKYGYCVNSFKYTDSVEEFKVNDKVEADYNLGKLQGTIKQISFDNPVKEGTALIQDKDGKEQWFRFADLKKLDESVNKEIKLKLNPNKYHNYDFTFSIFNSKKHGESLQINAFNNFGDTHDYAFIPVADLKIANIYSYSDIASNYVKNAMTVCNLEDQLQDIYNQLKG